MPVSISAVTLQPLWRVYYDGLHSKLICTGIMIGPRRNLGHERVWQYPGYQSVLCNIAWIVYYLVLFKKIPYNTLFSIPNTKYNIFLRPKTVLTLFYLGQCKKNQIHTRDHNKMSWNSIQTKGAMARYRRLISSVGGNLLPGTLIYSRMALIQSYWVNNEALMACQQTMLTENW